MLLLLTMWCAPSDERCLSWLWLTSFPLLPKAGWAAADRSSSMGEGVRPGVEHSHHRRGHCGGLLPAAHRHCWTHRSNTSPPSHAFLCILFNLFNFTDDYWDSFSEFDTVIWKRGCVAVLLCAMLLHFCFFDIFLSTWLYFSSFSSSNLEFPVPAWQWIVGSRWGTLSK